MSKTNDVVGLGNALMDFLIEVGEDTLLEFSLKKGEMHLVEEEKAKQILNKIEQEKLQIEFVPGGSAANTLKGVAFLGGKAILCGKVGKDKQGLNYVQQMEEHGVNTRINKHEHKLTGHAVTFITPDAQRTFSVHLGAALHLGKEEVLEEDIIASKILHLEGYQLEGDTKEIVLQAMEIACKNNTLISLDLADPGVIRRNKKWLHRIVRDYVDILFVNEKEAKEFTDLEEEKAALGLSKFVKIAVVKIGERGSIICGDEQMHYIAPFPATVIDTTGAGDTYAAGFLYGYCCGWSLEKCGKLGSLFASKVVEQKGMRIKHLDAEELKERVE
ncbi:adenosine kinase [Candidatus Woesearchaeota archaeon]|nr:adenosine kinase [Candidatus Woesearchaeota archaeon]